MSVLSDLSELLKIESVMSQPAPGAPFGEKMRETLDWFLNKAASYGLKTGNFDGYCGFAEYGEGDALIGILGHLDVVPAGGGWSYPPYALTSADGYLYGRGVVDNKGSVIIALHILKHLKENNIKLKNRIRLIVGCNEENGSRCMKYYKEHGEIPKMSIVPDSDFPIINSEKGILHLSVKILADEVFCSSILKLEAGSRPNVVPDNAKTDIKKDSVLYEKISRLCGGAVSNSLFSSPAIASAIISSGAKLNDFSVHIFEDKIQIETYGVSGHAMAPHKADNAVHKIFTLLEALGSPVSGQTACTVNKLFASPLAAERLGIACKDDKSGSLTMNLGIIDFKENSLFLTLDLRLPLCADKDEIVKKIGSALPLGGQVQILHYAENLYLDENCKLVQTLLKAYCSVTGEKGYTVQTGGGTYARELPDSVAFGPTFPDTVTNIHNADERISIEQFDKLYDIYYRAILDLDNI